MISPELKQTAARVLRHIADHAPMKAKEIAQEGLSPATVFRQLKALAAHGLVEGDDQGVYRLTANGRRWLDARTCSLEPFPELPIPALAKAPSLDRRDFLTLGMCAVAARAVPVSDRSLPGFVLVGEPGSYKTTVGRALIALAGGDVGKDCVLVAPGAGRGLLIRRDGRGAEVWRSHLLEVPVAVLDEVDKVDDGLVKTIIETMYFDGTPRVNNDGHLLDVRCTPVGVMNPFEKGASTFQGLTGFHESRERRIILVRLSEVSNTAKESRDWLAALVEADKDRQTKVPTPRQPDLDAIDRFVEIVQLVIDDPEVAKRLDAVYTLNNLARGATAWLDEERAIRLVALCWARLMAGNGYCRADWELRVQMYFAPEAVRKAHRARKRERRMKRLYKAVRAHLGGDVARACEAIAQAGAMQQASPTLVADMTELTKIIFGDLGGDAELAKRALRAATRLRRAGVSPEEAAVVAEDAIAFDITMKDARQAVEQFAYFRQNRLSSLTAINLVELAKSLRLSENDALYYLELGVGAFQHGYKLRDDASNR